jgi:hypothetical protein
MDEMKSESYNTAYAFMNKSKLGQKHLNFLPTPDDYKATLPSFAPQAAPVAPAANAAPANPVPSAQFRYDREKGTLNPATVKPAFPTF